MNVMLDITFLSKPQSTPNLVVYRYRTGILRARLKATLLPNALELGMLSVVKPTRLGSYLYSAKLPGFEEILFCDFADEIDAVRLYLPAAWDAVLTALIDNADQHVIVFLPAISQLSECSRWDDLARVGLLIDEVEITPDTIEPALRFLAASTDLAKQPRFMDQSSFLQSFLPILDDEPDLLTLTHTFDDRVLTCTDPVTEQYLPRQQQSETLNSRGRASPQQRLRALVTSKSGWDLVALVTVLDERRFRRDWTENEIIRLLYRQTSKALSHPTLKQSKSPNKRDPVGGQTSSHRGCDVTTLLWAVVLLAWEDRLVSAADLTNEWLRPTSNSFMSIVEQVGRDFLDRSKVDRRLDPCCGLTQALSRTHKARSREGDPLASAREKLFESLLNAMQPWAAGLTWVVRFQQRFGTKPITANLDELGEDPRSELRTTDSDPRSFDEIIGNPKIVEKLCQRLREKQQGTCTILYGPSGVGKRTLARVYAKSIMCDTPLPSGMACGRCYSCQGFDHGRFPFGFLEIDTKKGIQQIQVQYAVDDARPDHLAPTRVTVLLGIDSYTSVVSDRLLKTLEDGKHVAFLLTVEDLTKVRLAVQSRSEAYRMRPLNFVDTRKRLKDQIGDMKVDIDEKVMDLLVASSAGLPGEIRRVVDKFEDLEDHDLETVRSALGWNWVHDTSELWRLMLEHDGVPGSPTMKPLLIKPTISVQRMQAFLHQIWLVMTLVPVPKLGSVEPPFLHYDSQTIRAVADLLCQSASAMAKTPEQLWRELAKLWTDLDILDENDLYKAAHDTRSLVARGGKV